MKNHIVIIGFNGSGKKRVGKRLAKDLGLPYVDVDKEIVRKMKMSINEIYTRFGEPFYRALETTQIKELAEIDLKCVISVGAGLPLQEQNHKCLKELGTVVYLKASVETLAERLKNDNTRPMLEGGDLKERITTLQNQRKAVYEQVCDVRIATDKKDFLQITEEIRAAVEKIS